MKNYKIFLRQKNESWQQALDRFFRFREADMKEYFSNKDYSYRFADNKAYDYLSLGKATKESLDDFEEQYGVNIPDSLRHLLLNHGGFRIGASLLEIYSGSDGRNPILTLSQILREYGYEKFTDKVSPGMLKSVSSFYFFFGISFPESEEIAFLYFNKAGNFGKMLFAPDNEVLVLKKILPSMFNGSIDKYSLDELMATQTDRVVINALTVRGYIE